MLETHFIATPIAGGYSWTLPSRLGQLLSLAESKFGPRDKTYTILGVEFGQDVPHLWYPGNCKNIVIQLGPNALDNDYLARYQLAHECIHLLSPSGGQHAPVIEEGLAVVFAEEYVGPNADGVSPTDDPKYAACASVVRRLLSDNPGFIMDLRAIEPAFTNLTAEHLSRALPQIDEATIHSLLLPFYQTEVQEILGWKPAAQSEQTAT